MITKQCPENLAVLLDVKMFLKSKRKGVIMIDAIRFWDAFNQNKGLSAVAFFKI